MGVKDLRMQARESVIGSEGGSEENRVHRRMLNICRWMRKDEDGGNGDEWRWKSMERDGSGYN